MIYLDNAATTAVKNEVLEAMLPFYREKFGNPSGIYELATESRKEIEGARKNIAKTIGAGDEEIYFTSGGTEADNWAIRSVAENYQDKGRHIITTMIEHHAVLHTCKYLERKGYKITYLNVDEYGIIRLDELKRAIGPDTILISVMFANNEMGAIQPIREIGLMAKKRGIVFHTDAVQAYCHVPIDVNYYNIDLMSISGHKIHGPKGVGFLYVRDGVKLSPMIFGGSQEKERRAGTENVPGIIGLSVAATLGNRKLRENMQKTSVMRDYLIKRVLKEIPYARLNGHQYMRLPGNVNFSFGFVDGASLLVLLDEEGICASGGSACNSSSGNPSHVLKAMGLSDEVAYGALRLTIEADTTKEEIDNAVNIIKKCVKDLRSKSEVYRMVTSGRWR